MINAKDFRLYVDEKCYPMLLEGVEVECYEDGRQEFSGYVLFEHGDQIVPGQKLTITGINGLDEPVIFTGTISRACKEVFHQKMWIFHLEAVSHPGHGVVETIEGEKIEVPLDVKKNIDEAMENEDALRSSFSGSAPFSGDMRPFPSKQGGEIPLAVLENMERNRAISEQMPPVIRVDAIYPGPQTFVFFQVDQVWVLNDSSTFSSPRYFLNGDAGMEGPCVSVGELKGMGCACVVFEIIPDIPGKQLTF